MRVRCTFTTTNGTYISVDRTHEPVDLPTLRRKVAELDWMYLDDGKMLNMAHVVSFDIRELDVADY